MQDFSPSTTMTNNLQGFKLFKLLQTLERLSEIAIDHCFAGISIQYIAEGQSKLWNQSTLPLRHQQSISNKQRDNLIVMISYKPFTKYLSTIWFWLLRLTAISFDVSDKQPRNYSQISEKQTQTKKIMSCHVCDYNIKTIWGFSIH